MARSMPSEDDIESPPCTLEAIKKPVHTELTATRKLIAQELHAKVPLIQTITTYLIERGGKRLRPTLLLLAAKAVQSYEWPCLADSTAKPVALAAVVEMIHSATLLHDDIVDESTLRRGQQTANAAWGNAASVLAGDFLYSRAFQLLAKVADIPISTVLADTTNELAEGEMLQLTNAHCADMCIEDYWQVIQLKTATLFACACRIGAMASCADHDTIEALARFGLQFGMAYQIIDDTLDYQDASKRFGKDRFNDLSEGKMTLPLILAKQTAAPALAQQITAIIDGEAQPDAHQEAIYEVMLKHRIFEQCHAHAQHYIEEAKQALSQVATNSQQNESLEALSQLCDFMLRRDY